jgi:tetratricopeptide (TPR) repeat protein
MLETIREYASEHLELSGEADDLRAAHAAYFVDLAEEGEAGLQGSDQSEWLARLSREHDNMRVALSWAMERRDEELALRLTGALWRFWWIRAYLREGGGWIHAALDLGHDGYPRARAQALTGAGNLAWAQGAYWTAESYHHAALDLRRRLGDKAGEARSLNNLGAVAETQGKYKEAAALYEESLEVAGAAGDLRTYALALGNLGGARISLGEYNEARAACEESLARWHELGDRVSETRVLNNIVFLLLDQKQFVEAAGYQAQSIRLLQETGNTENVAVCLDGAAEILSGLNRPDAAARLWGAAENLRETLGQHVAPNSADSRDSAISASRSSIDPIAFDAAWATGRAMSSATAEEYALEELEG